MRKINRKGKSLERRKRRRMKRRRRVEDFRDTLYSGKGQFFIFISVIHQRGKEGTLEGTRVMIHASRSERVVLER